MQQKKLFYFKGKEELIPMRKRIAKYSLENASKRLALERERRERRE